MSLGTPPIDPSLHLNPFGDLDGLINLEAKISNRALDFRMAQWQLHGPQLVGSPVDQRRLGSAQRMWED
jgi:hypothetical protein